MEPIDFNAFQAISRTPANKNDTVQAIYNSICANQWREFATICYLISRAAVWCPSIYYI